MPHDVAMWRFGAYRAVAGYVFGFVPTVDRIGFEKSMRQRIVVIHEHVFASPGWQFSRRTVRSFRCVERRSRCSTAAGGSSDHCRSCPSDDVGRIWSRCRS